MGNERHVADTKHVNVTVQTGTGMRNLVVTADHVMLTMNGTLLVPTLVKAQNLVVGDFVSLQGEVRGVIVSISHEVLNHKNELVTTAGTVFANGVHVTTICADQLISTDARHVIPTWQKTHALLGAISI